MKLQIRTINLFALTFLLTFVSACTTTGQRTESIQSKASAAGMVVTANPHATRAGADVLRAGGSAVDAAIAIEAVLSLVEPQSSGLAGGAFMMHYDHASKSLDVYDGRETAPAKATADMFLKANAEKMGYLDAKHSGLSTGVPGVFPCL